ncbi:hypothetical protein QJS10_CPB20g00801 [Acorus calamus]|uniref:Uncharacterized protein n=1 Tax=Acorus calamus TaxID=4465 RepID=A0AAV9CBD2_ACOCL|nr:hypothetical protein QJS10_CPB20g00801 [Acorus calamus]
MSLMCNVMWRCALSSTLLITPSDRHMAFTSQGISFDRETEQSEHLNGICIDDLRDLDKMPDKEEVEEWVKLLKGSTSGMKGANGSNEEEAQTTSVAAEALKKAKFMPPAVKWMDGVCVSVLFFFYSSVMLKMFGLMD